MKFAPDEINDKTYFLIIRSLNFRVLPFSFPCHAVILPVE